MTCLLAISQMRHPCIYWGIIAIFVTLVLQVQMWHPTSFVSEYHVVLTVLCATLLHRLHRFYRPTGKFVAGHSKDDVIKTVSIDVHETNTRLGTCKVQCRPSTTHIERKVSIWYICENVHHVEIIVFLNKISYFISNSFKLTSIPIPMKSTDRDRVVDVSRYLFVVK